MERLRLDDVLDVHLGPVVDGVEARELPRQEEVGVGGRPHPVGVLGRLHHPAGLRAPVAEGGDLTTTNKGTNGRREEETQPISLA